MTGGSGTRSEVGFRSGSVTCRAWLYRPASGGAKRAPIIVMAHGLGGTRSMRLDAFADRFAAAGYGCLVFDYRYHGDSDGLPRQLVDIPSQLQDWSAAIAYARTLADFDRVVVWGTSLGGGHALVSAARERSVAAVVAQCPFTDGAAAALAVPPVAAVKMLARGLRDTVARFRGRAPVMIDTAGPPGSTALLTSPDAAPGLAALMPAENPPPGFVSARFGLQAGTYLPWRRVAHIEAPVLYAVCENDVVTPARRTLAVARRTPRAEVRIYPCGHFDIYVGDGFERAVGDQIDFLRRHVPPAAA